MPTLQAEPLDAAVGESGDPPVWLCLLGRFRLVSGGQPVSIRSGGKTEALLAHLGLAGVRGIPRGTLLRAVWPHSEPALAGQALNSLLHRLRMLVSEALKVLERRLARWKQTREVSI